MSNRPLEKCLLSLGPKTMCMLAIATPLSPREDIWTATHGMVPGSCHFRAYRGGSGTAKAETRNRKSWTVLSSSSRTMVSRIESTRRRFAASWIILSVVTKTPDARAKYISQTGDESENSSDTLRGICLCNDLSQSLTIEN